MRDAHVLQKCHFIFARPTLASTLDLDSQGSHEESRAVVEKEDAHKDGTQ